jgi:hypothetical protein
MSARSCQLCGKPLSRFSSGSGGDFCSRDHRNQFRLRQGMGRLQEANQVATVMRRREQLRPLPNASTPNSSNIDRRGFFELQFAPAAKPLIAFHTIAAHLPTLRIGATSNQYIPARATAGVGKAESRNAAAVRFAMRRKPVASRRRLQKPPVQMQQAHLVQGECGATPPEAKRREYGMSVATRKRLVWTFHSSGSTRLRLSGGGANLGGTKSAAARGNALRVSFACGIRARKLTRSFAPIGAQLSARLRWREKRDRLQAMGPGKANTRLAEGVAIPAAGVVCPTGPSFATLGPPVAQRTLGLPMPSISYGADLPAHVVGKAWTLQNDVMELPELPLKPWQPSRLHAVPHKEVKPSVVKGRGQTIHLLAPFVPQDAPCGFSFSVNQNGSKDQKR